MGKSQTRGRRRGRRSCTTGRLPAAAGQTVQKACPGPAPGLSPGLSPDSGQYPSPERQGGEELVLLPVPAAAGLILHRGALSAVLCQGLCARTSLPGLCAAGCVSLPWRLFRPLASFPASGHDFARKQADKCAVLVYGAGNGLVSGPPGQQCHAAEGRRTGAADRHQTTVSLYHSVAVLQEDSHASCRSQYQ